MMTVHDIEQVDAVLSEDGRSVGIYGHTPDDDQTFFWSINLPMLIEEDAFDDMITEWRQVGWEMLMREA